MEHIFLKQLEGLLWSFVELSQSVVVQHHGLMTFTLDFQGQMLEKRITGIGWSINMELKGYELIGSGTHFLPLNFILSLYLEFLRSNLKKLYFRNGGVNWHGTNGMWVDRMLDILCDLWLWSWPRIFNVKFGEKKPYPRKWRIDWHGTKGM